MLMFYLFLSETYEPLTRDTFPHPFPFGKIFKKLDFSIEACIQITCILISFNFSGPPSKLVPHFLVHSYSSANSMHV